MNDPAVQYYFQRFGFVPRQISLTVPPDLGLVVVIPCYNEPDLIASLQSLDRCERAACRVEVIVVINSGEDAIESVRQQNRKTFESATIWMAGHGDKRLQFHLLHFPELPSKKAGVGLARKIGMDEALRRFDSVNRLDGVIVCFDADCECDSNYLVEIERFFLERPGAHGASIYFEHPLEGSESPQVYEGVKAYELHLRYYVEALRYSGFPHAFHTIGSSMAVRARDYFEQGGMNKRKAGEDFYFLHKVIPLGGFGEINATRVIASPRPSDRVPFGTGRAVREYLDAGKVDSYPLQAFDDLRFFFADLPELYESDAPSMHCSEALQNFLKEQHVSARLKSIRENTRNQLSFQKRFFRWFDGFMAMKFIHFARDQMYGSGDVLEVARELYGRRTRQIFRPVRGAELLMAYRSWQRG